MNNKGFKDKTRLIDEKNLQNRRKFLTGAGIAACGIAAHSSSLAQVQSNPDNAVHVVGDYDELRSIPASTFNEGDLVHVSDTLNPGISGVGTVMNNGSPRQQILGWEEPFNDNPNFYWKRQYSGVIVVDSFLDSGDISDAVGIQRAIDAMPNSGFTLLFTKPVYFLHTGINLTNKRGFKLWGMGNGDGVRTVIEMQDVAEVALLLTACKGAEIKGFSFRSTAVGAPLAHGVELKNECSDCSISQCLFSNFNLAIDLNGAYICSITENQFAGNQRDVYIRSGTQTVHNFINRNVFGDHHSDMPCIDIGDAKNRVKGNSFECNSTNIFRIVYVRSSAQETLIYDNVTLANTQAVPPNGCGGILSESASTKAHGNIILGDTNIPNNGGLIEGRFSSIVGNTLSSGTNSTVKGVRLFNQSNRCTISANNFINHSFGIEFSNGKAVVVSGNVFSGVAQCFKDVGENTTVSSNQFHNCSSFGNAISLAGCELEFIAGTQTLTQNASAPSVLGSKVVKTNNTVPTSLSSLEHGYDGQHVTILVNDVHTIFKFSSFGLNGNGGIDWSPSKGDHVTCTKIDGQWYCTLSSNSA